MGPTREQIEDSLLESQKKLREVQRIANFGDWSRNFITNEIYWGEQTYRIFGLEPDNEKIIYSKLTKIIHPEDVDGVTSALESAKKNHTRYSHDYRVVWPDRSIHWIHVDGEITYKNNEAVSVQGVVHDITDRKDAEQKILTSQNEMERLLTNLVDTVYRADNEGVLVFVSKSAKQLFGYEPEELIGKKATDLYADPLERARFLETMRCNGGKVSGYESILLKKDGSRIWVSTSAQFYRDEKGNVLGLEGVARDVTEKKNLERMLEENSEKYKSLFEEHRNILNNSPDGIIKLDENLKIVFMNASMKKLLGLPEGQEAKTIGVRITDIPSVQKAGMLPYLEKLNKKESIDFEAPFFSLYGKFCYMAAKGVPLLAGDRFTGAILVIADITEKKKSEEALVEMAAEMSHQASHDALTGLLNRREFEKRLEDAIASAKKINATHALCYMDLDQFKVINDTNGHMAGDELLRQLSPLLLKGMRSSDYLARLGGDEFGILLHSCSLEKAEEIILQLQDRIKDFRFVWDDKIFSIGASIGLVSITSSGGNLSELLSAADSACYVAKENGRNRLHVYQQDDLEVAYHQGHMQWFNRITAALEDNFFELFFQKINSINLEGKRQIQGEFLLRMKNSDGELIAPGKFLPAAERYHLMQKIDMWVLKNVLSFLKESTKIKDGDSIFTVNISAQSLNNDSFVHFFHKQIRETGVNPSQICFEITETVAITNLTYAIEFMENLRSAGCRFALDDFGSGVSSLANLKKLPVDYVKIDGEFVREMIDDPADQVMVKSIIEICKVLKLETIAEYVENKVILEKLEELGVNYMQGYHIGHPEPAGSYFW